MSEQVLVGHTPTGKPVYAEVLTQDEIVEQLKASPEWQAFRDRFDMSKAENDTLLGMLFKEKLGDDPTLENYRRLIKTVFQAGGVVVVDGTSYEFIVREAEPEVVEEEIPLDKNGRPLGESQQRWSEYRQFAETHSSQDCRDRARVDAGFASFVRLNLEREARETSSTQFQLAGQSSAAQKRSVTPELVAWVEEFRKTSMERVRQLRSPAMNPLGFEKYNQLLAAALAAGLIGR